MRRTSIGWVFSLLGLAAITAGCTGEPAASPASSSSPAEAAVESKSSATDSAAAPAPDTSVTLESVDTAGLEAAIKAQAGKVVFVDFWATWCAPCKEGFPHTVEMAKKYKDQGLAVISVSCDEADAKAEALKFLQEKQAAFQNFIATNGFDALDTFEIEGGALPYYRLYDRQGKLVRGIGPDPEKGLGPDEVEALVKQEVEKK